MTLPATTPPTLPHYCLNCDQPFDEYRPNFCPACGQETTVKAPTIAEFLHQFGGAYFATEGALWRTLKLLLFSPGELTRQHLQGRRKHYVLPVRLYMSISLVAILLIRAMSINAGANIVLPPENQRMVKNFTIGMGVAAAGFKNDQFYCTGLPEWACKKFEQQLSLSPKALIAEISVVGDRVIARLAYVMFLLMPIFALGLKLLYLNRGLLYTEHLVFTLHLHAFWFFVLPFMQFNIPLLSGVVAIWVPIYALLAMRRVYGGSWWRLVLSAAIQSLIYSTLLSIALVALMLIGFATA